MADATNGNNRYTPKTVYDDFNQNVPDVVQPNGGTNLTGATSYTPQGTGDAGQLIGLDFDKENPPTEKAGFWAATGASIGNTGRDWKEFFNGNSTFEPDVDYYKVSKDVADEWFNKNGRYSEDETAYLNGAVSHDDFNYRVTRLLDRRERMSAQSGSMAGTLVGSVIDVDIFANFIPFVGQVKWADRARYAAVVAGGAAAVNAQNVNSVRSDLEQNLDPLIFGVSGLFGSSFKGVRSARNAAAVTATEDVAEGATAGTRVTDDLVDPLDDVVELTPIVRTTDDAVELADDVAPTVRTDVPSLPKNLEPLVDVDIAVTKQSMDDLFVEGAGVRGTLNDGTEVRVIGTNDGQYKNKHHLQVFNEATGEKLGSLTYFTKGGARTKHTELTVEPMAAGRGVESILHDYAVANGGKLPSRSTTQARYLPDDEATVSLSANVQAARAVDAQPTPTPKSDPLEQSIAHAADDIVQEQSVKATENGHLGDVEIMGETLPVPISQPLDASRWQMPDWYKNTFGKWIESSADMLYRLADGIPDEATKTRLRHLLADPRTQGANATYHAAAVNAELEAALIPFENALQATVRDMYGTTGWKVWERAKHLENLQTVMKEFQFLMQRTDRMVQQKLRAGLKVTPDDIEAMFKADADPRLIELQRVYIKSGFAETAYDHMVRTGMIDAELAAQLPRRSTYMPLRHSYEKIDGLLKSLSDKDILYKYIGEQIMRMHPTLQDKSFTLTAKQLGMNFVRTQEKSSANLAEISSTGISADGMRKILEGSGLAAADIETAIKRLVPQMDTQGSNAYKNLRQRIDWDWDFTVRDPKTGRMLSMSDIVDTDVVLTLNDYARSTSKRVGLAHYNIKTIPELDDLLMQVVTHRPKEISIDEAEAFVRNVKDSLLGLPVGENLAPTVRTLNTLGGSMVLSGGGIWQVMDLATQVMKLGVLRSLPQIRKGLKHSVTALKGTSKEDAQSLYDILTQRLSTEGRWRGLSMRFEDNFDVHSGVHERVAYLGQSVRYVNFTESVKRLQVGLIGGVFVSAFEGASKGRAKDIKFLKQNLKMSDELVAGIQDQYSKFGGAIDNWEQGIRVAMEQKVFFEADNLAYTIRTGELPPFMEHSAVGKALFPFMSFTMSMQKKLLSNTYQRDGFTGLAMLGAVQLPMAVLLGMVANVKNGKDPEEDLGRSAIAAMSMLGIWNIPISAIEGGGWRGGGTIFTPFNKAFNATKTVFDDEATAAETFNSIQDATPFLGAMTGLHMAVSLFDED